MSRKIYDIETKTKHVYLSLEWCKSYFGVSSTKRRKLKFKISPRLRKNGSYKIYGIYCFYRNEMIIYVNNCDTIYDVVSTVIHEYTHYLQSRTRYKKYENSYYYSHNPYERQAKRNEDKYTKKCIYFIKKLTNNLRLGNLN